MSPKRTRRRYTAEFKAGVALAAITERQPLAELAATITHVGGLARLHGLARRGRHVCLGLDGPAGAGQQQGSSN